MNEQEREPQEYEFIMDGITTRMQIALEKMAESNKLMHSAVKWVCAVSTGGLAGILGVKPASQNADSGDRAVTRYEMSLIQENTLLKANQYTDAEVGGVRQAIAQQAVHNAASDGLIQTLQGQVYQLFGLTKLVVPNGNVAPGWGPAFVVPGVPPVPTVQTTPPTVSSGGTTAAAAA